MSSVIISGDSSGTITLQAPAVSGSTTINLPATSGTATVMPTGYTLGAGNTSNFKNRIINGDMRIDQRNAGASVAITSAGNYVTDRFYGFATQSSKLTMQQSTTAPAGFTNSLLATSLSAYTVGSTEQFTITQQIEGLNVADLGFGTVNALTVTLSFWVRCSLTGTFGGALKNSDSSRSYPFSYTISSANTWEQKSITIAGDTTGTWLTTNGRGISVNICLGAGSTLSGTAGAWAAGNYPSVTGATSVVGTSGATFYITGVQLEVGSTATSFDYRDYGRELAMCQRYYTKFTCPDSTIFMMGIINVTTNVYGGGLTLPATMRTTPTLTQSNLRTYDATTSSAISAIASNQSSKEVISAEFTTSGMIVGRSAIVSGNASSSAFISASAEL